jgi:ComF family protein
MQFLENIFQAICAQLLPTACIICDQFQGSTMCRNCKHRLEENALCNYECCFQCGIPLKQAEIIQQQCDSCQKSPPYFDETYCLDRYDGVLQNALHQLKYQKRIAFAHGLSNAWNDILSGELSHAHANYLLPVPLSSEKLWLRGFNQSWELARRIHCIPSVEKLPHVLKRHHRFEQQAGSSLNTRQSKVRDTFYLDQSSIGLLQNKSIIVFDDVMTSGSTLDEIARLLKDNGASRVINWVLLRTTKPIEESRV